MLFFWNVGTLAASTGLTPATSGIFNNLEVTQFIEHVKSRSISHWLKEKSRNPQKLLKYFNGTTSAYNVLSSAGVLSIIFALYSKDLLVIVFLLFIV